MRYRFPQIDDEIRGFDIRLNKGEYVNLKELFDIGEHRASKVESIIWRADLSGIYADIYLLDYIEKATN
jgi:hypothetical protein